MVESKPFQVSDNTKATIESLKVDPQSITPRDKVIGHELAKADLRLGIRLPTQSPHLVRETDAKRTFLVHGPPRVGKSKLAVWFASIDEGCTIFKVKASLLGGWDNKIWERVVHLFNGAGTAAPSAVLLDDIEKVLGRSVSDYTLQSDLMKKISSSKQVIVIGVTSSPWLLDEGIWPLFDSYHHVELPIPSDSDRIGIIKLKLNAVPHNVSDHEIDQLAERFKGLSGNKIEKMICSVVSRLVNQAMDAQFFRDIDFKGSKWSSPCEQHDEGAQKASYSDIASHLQPRNITYADFEGHGSDLQRTVQILDVMNKKHAKWAAKHFYDNGIRAKRPAAQIGKSESDNVASEESGSED